MFVQSCDIFVGFEAHGTFEAGQRKASKSVALEGHRWHLLEMDGECARGKENGRS